MRHGIDAIGGDLEIEHRVVAVLLDRLDGVADVGEPPPQLVVAEVGKVNVVVEPVSGELHRAGDCSSAPTMLPWPRANPRSSFAIAVVIRRHTRAVCSIRFPARSAPT